MVIPATAIVASVICFLAFFLEISRTREYVPKDQDGDLEVALSLAAHRRFFNYVPFVLIIMAIGELIDSSLIWVYLAAIFFVIGRAAHTLNAVCANQRSILFKTTEILGTWLAIPILVAVLALNAGDLYIDVVG